MWENEREKKNEHLYTGWKGIFKKDLKGYTPNHKEQTLWGRKWVWGPGAEGNFHFLLNIFVYNLKRFCNFEKTKASDKELAILYSAFCFFPKEQDV